MSYADPSFVNPCPDLTSDEYAELKAKIEKQGFLPAYPVIVSAGPARLGEIVDGFHRTKICAELGIQPTIVAIPFETDAEFELEQIDANLTRRQLNRDQRIRLVHRRSEINDRIVAEGLARMRAGKSAQSDPSQDLDEGPNGRRTDAQQAAMAQTNRTTYRQHTAVIDSGDVFLNAELAAERMSTDRAFKALQELKSAEAELDVKFEGGYSEYRQFMATRDAEQEHQREWDKDYEEHFHVVRPDDSHDYRERSAGEVVRLLMDMDRLITKNRLTAADVKQLRSRPHTFLGAARRLNEWLGEIEEVL